MGKFKNKFKRIFTRKETPKIEIINIQTKKSTKKLVDENLRRSIINMQKQKERFFYEKVKKIKGLKTFPTMENFIKTKKIEEKDLLKMSRRRIKNLYAQEEIRLKTFEKYIEEKINPRLIEDYIDVVDQNFKGKISRYNNKKWNAIKDELRSLSPKQQEAFLTKGYMKPLDEVYDEIIEQYSVDHRKRFSWGSLIGSIKQLKENY